MSEIQFLIIIISLAVIFEFINGFHDTANAIATVVATRVLPPAGALLMSAGLNFLGALSGTAVAKTIGSGIIGTNVSKEVIAAALIGAIIWNLITWYSGIPSSSSHALIGGLVGAGIGSTGVNMVRWSILLQKVIIPFVLSPFFGFLGALILIKILFFIFRNFELRPVNRIFRRFQIISSAFMAFSHGSNDAQKTMGIITLALINSHMINGTPFHVPVWVMIFCASVMAFGTAVGGWRIIKTMGTKLFTMKPIDGFAAETAAATVIESASRLGFPLSTTHIITSSIIGVGSSHRYRMKNVRWHVAGNIVRAWIITIPTCALISFLVFSALSKVIAYFTY